MNLIARDQADLINVEPEDLYLAGRIYNLEPFAQEDIDGSQYATNSLLIVAVFRPQLTVSPRDLMQSFFYFLVFTLFTFPIIHSLIHSTIRPSSRNQKSGIPLDLL